MDRSSHFAYTVPFAVYLPKEEEESGIEKPQLTHLIGRAVRGPVPSKFEELVFLCARPDPRRFGTRLFEAVIVDVRSKGTPVLLFAGQARHMRAPGLVDYVKTRRVADHFYREYWKDVPVRMQNGRVVYDDTHGYSLSIDADGADMPLWVKVVV